MSNRTAVPDAQKDVVWMRDIEDRLKALETRKVQGNLAIDNLAINEALTFPGSGEALSAAILNDGLAFQQKASTAAVTLTTTSQDVPGVALTATRIGYYAVVFFADFLVSVAQNATGIVSLVAGTGTTVTGQSALFLDAAGGPIARATVGNFAGWNVPTLQYGATLKMVALKNAVSASVFQAVAPNTGMIVFRVGPSR